MTKKIEAKVTHQFAASASRVYEAWLEPDKVRIWMSAALQKMGLSGEVKTIDIDATVGGKFLFTDLRNGVEARHWGTYLELEPHRRIVFTWITDEADESDPSKVVVEIEPADQGCIVTIVHEMDAKWLDFLGQTENGWGCMLEATESALSGQ